MAERSKHDVGGCGRAIVFLMLIALGAAIYGVLTADVPPRNPHAPTESEMKEAAALPSAAYRFVEAHVSASLKSPSTATFPNASERKSHVLAAGNSYTITSWVDSQNGFGAVIRTHFKAEVEKLDSNTWQLNSLEMYE